MNTPKCYLWRAYQSEPGCDGYRLALSAAPDVPPPSIEHNTNGNGLVYEGSVYDDWRLVGEVSGDADTDAYGTDYAHMVIAGDRMPVDVHQILRNHWYKAL